MSVQGGGYYQAVKDNLNNKLYGGSRSDFSNAGRASVGARIQYQNQVNTMNNISKIQNAAQMYGLNLDANSIFNMADLNGNGTITEKETTSFMSKLPQLASMSGAAGGAAAGGASGGDSGGGLLGKVGDLLGGSAGSIIGGLLGGSGGEDGGGGVLGKIGGLFGGGDAAGGAAGGADAGGDGGSFLDKAGDFLGGLFG